MDSSATIGGLATTQIMGSKTVTAVDWTGYNITAGAAADSADIGGGLNVKVSKNIPWSVIYLNEQSLTPVGTTIFTSLKRTTGKSFAGTETPYQLDTEFFSLATNKTQFADNPKVVANTAIETAELGSNVKSFQLQSNFSTGNSFVSPMIDLQRSSATLIDYQIDRQDSASTTNFNVPLSYVSETSARGGTAASKHITRVIKLAESAVGIKVLLAANKPVGAYFDLYWRVCAADENIFNKDWTLQLTESNNPDARGMTTFREYEYLIGGTSGTIPQFDNFQLKIVFHSTNRSKIARIKDLRTIALSV